MAEIINRRAELTTVTPMMKQYLEVKEQYPDYVLMYRLGDFYECFFDDALIASRELELTLTARDCGDGKRAAMCGVPFHKADVYVGRLVEHGFKVAICEQTENPKEAVGLVKRSVTRVVTPGTVTDSAVLTESENNYLATIVYGQGCVAIGFADVSTGAVYATYIDGEDYVSRAANELSVYQPSEAIFNVSAGESGGIATFLHEKFNTLIDDKAKRHFDYDKARERVRQAFADESQKLDRDELILAVGALLSYISETQKSDKTFVKDLVVYSGGQFLELDMNTRRNLELVETMRAREKKGTLLWVLDKTKTAMGSRLLYNWILKPLVSPVQISHRQAAVADMLRDRQRAEELSELLSGFLDLERLTARVVYGTANPKDLRAICTSLQRLPALKELLRGFESNTIKEIEKNLDPLEKSVEMLSTAIVDDPPLSVRDGGFIRDNYNHDVDRLRNIIANGSDIMSSIEERERERTGIKTLKIGYNKIFGYYIEVTKSLVSQVPPDYIRKQTLTGCERYITQELKDMENTILSADEQLVNIEYLLFCVIRDTLAMDAPIIRTVAALVAELDVYRSFAEVASKNSYVCPEVDLSSDVIIKDGRHPVVERFVKDSYFVPNDTCLDTSLNRMMIITGPNMAGKSTYMRQVAIITLMAQIGSFVPAREAKIGVVDKIFTRVGASDDLASGQSTFMLEMNEVATILKNATKRSLIIYDEVGRGTSTYDGMAIARAVVEYTHSKKIGAKTLFATHYHELTDMEEQFEGIINYNIAAKKRGDGIIFLRKIVKGGTDDSYGIEVAKLAGVPGEVVRRAKEILADIEKGAPQRSCAPVQRESDSFGLLSSIAMSKDGEAADRIRNTDINTMTPIEAMNLLFELKKMLS